jgi:prevent-host-death family protein
VFSDVMWVEATTLKVVTLCLCSNQGGRSSGAEAWTKPVSAEVEDGTELVVTDRGRPIARVIPASGSSTERLLELISRGEAESAPTPKDDWLPEAAKLADGVTISDLVAEQRR